MHRRLTMVTRNARGERMSPLPDCCQRMKVSWRMSSASDTPDSIRYAIENSRLRYWSNVAIRIEVFARASGLPLWPSRDTRRSSIRLCLLDQARSRIVTKNSGKVALTCHTWRTHAVSCKEAAQIIAPTRGLRMRLTSAFRVGSIVNVIAMLVQALFAGEILGGMSYGPALHL